MKINPHFVTVDEVHAPSDQAAYSGWGPRGADEKDVLDFEARFSDACYAEAPQPFGSEETTDERPNNESYQKWVQFQKDRGRYEGSNDLTLLDEFCLGKDIAWLPQIIGSCVLSNTFRAWVIRLLYQMFILGKAEEFIGRNEFGVNNLSFYGPFTYGLARRKANMRRGDGLYCSPMAWALAQGVVPCDNQTLRRITSSNGVGGDRDYPEPQSKSFYRAMGNWKYLDELSPFMQTPVDQYQKINNGDELWAFLESGKPGYVCSSEAIHKIGEHKDGFPIHARNPRDSWAHNMAWHGNLVASDGERFFRQSNRSWGKKHIYNRKFNEVDKRLRSGRLDCRIIGNIQALKSNPITIV